MSAFYDFGLILAFCDAKIKIPEIMKLKTSLKSNFYLKNIKLKNYQIHNLINAPFLAFTINLNQHKFPSIWNLRMNVQTIKVYSLKDFSIPCRGKFYYQNSIDS